MSTEDSMNLVIQSYKAHHISSDSYENETENETENDNQINKHTSKGTNSIINTNTDTKSSHRHLTNDNICCDNNAANHDGNHSDSSNNENHNDTGTSDNFFHFDDENKIKMSKKLDVVLNLRIGIIHATWNRTIIDLIVNGTIKKLIGLGILERNIIIQSVPAYIELPVGTKIFVSNQKRIHKDLDIVIPIGVLLIKGDSMQVDYSELVTKELTIVQRLIDVPIIFGLLTLTNEQYQNDNNDSNIDPSALSYYEEWGAAAAEMGVKVALERFYINLTANNDTTQLPSPESLSDSSL
ncbi:Lumazine synthase [Ascoidea rubescens DSM 1968]|uniref:6,7-dimethyl-8-ribityllumazine synthase n=1 Tax=Ascoidea rubescens DSM 1968 TaxID=1344418 RepID=A0A1D2VFD3_9ASCO|nr:Lumazine synthase [Ascoidea rubescens DSM 1968]ODV60230.1 Lumazine synthase [Ascoidea rubescens DSM 1968]